MATVARMRRQGRSQGSAAVGARRVGGPVAAGLLATGLASGIALAALGGPAGATNSHVQTIHVSTAKVAHVGTVLTTGAGLTLYHFVNDPAGMATCTGGCAKIYPPFLASKGAHIDGPRGVKGLSLINVGGGHWQVAFDHFALYRFEGDKKKGQAKANGLANVWFAALKSGISAKAGAPAVQTPTTSSSSSTSTTRGATSTTQGSSSSHAATTTPPTQTPAQTPTTQAPAPPTTQPPPPTTTPTTSSPPPTTTPTTTGGGGGVGF